MSETTPPKSMTCPLCGGVAFQPGFIDDAAQGRVRWFTGRFEKGLLGNAKGRMTLPKTPVIAYRCSGCSHLELFAGGPI